MGWTLDQVRDLAEDDYDEVVRWLKDRADQASGEGSIDMDEVLAAKAKKDRHPDGND